MSPTLAVAWSFVREWARRPLAWLFLVLAAGSGVVLSRWASSGASLSSRLQLSVSYGLGFSCFLASLATVHFSAGLAREVENRRIWSLVMKPAGALSIVLGKLLAILLLDSVILAAAFGAFAANSAFLYRGAVRSGEDRRSADERFLKARAPVLPVIAPPDESMVQSRVEALRRSSGNMGAGAEEATPAALDLRARRSLRLLRLRPGDAAELSFIGVDFGLRLGTEGGIVLRHELHSSRPGESPSVEVEWQVVSDAGAAALVARAAHGVPQEVTLPASAAAIDGPLRIRVRNASAKDTGSVLILDPLKVEILPVYGGLFPNALRVFAVILLQLAVLASAGLLAGAVFTPATVVFVGLFLYFTALSAGFLRETFALFSGAAAHETWREAVGSWAVFFGSAVLDVLPDFTAPDALGRMAAGRAVTVPDLLHAAIWNGGVECLAACLAGAWLLRRRELGKEGGA